MQIATESRHRTRVLAASSPASFSSRRDFCRRRAENWSACNFQAVNSSRPAVNAPESVRLLRFRVFSRVARIFARIHSTRRFAPAAEGGGRGGEGEGCRFSRGALGINPLLRNGFKGIGLSGRRLPPLRYWLRPDYARNRDGFVAIALIDFFLSLPPSPPAPGRRAEVETNPSIIGRINRRGGLLPNILFPHPFEFKARSDEMLSEQNWYSLTLLID